MQGSQSQGRLNQEADNRRQIPQQAPQQPPHQGIRQSLNTYLGMVPTVENLNFIEQHKILFLSGKTEVIDPDNESYPYMLHQSYCPHWRLFSLTTIFLIICTIYYVVAVSLGFNNNTFLEVNQETYVKLGTNNAKGVYKGEVYRLLVNFFLHVNIKHLFANMLGLTLMLSAIENTFGWIRTALIYMLSAVVGNIFSNLLSVDEASSMIKAGATIALFGTVGVGVAYLLINWPSLAIVGPYFKFKIFAHLFLMIIYLLLFCDVATNVDYAGYLGSFLAGFFLGGALPSIALQSWQKTIRIILFILFITMTLVCFLCFYLAPQAGYSA